MGRSDLKPNAASNVIDRAATPRSVVAALRRRGILATPMLNHRVSGPLCIVKLRAFPEPAALDFDRMIRYQ